MGWIARVLSCMDINCDVSRCLKTSGASNLRPLTYMIDVQEYEQVFGYDNRPFN